jgi:uncharacterized protein (UPF0335 family)
MSNLIASLSGLRAGNVKDAHIGFLKEQLQVVMERVKKLEEENTRLVASQTEDEKELARYRKTAETKQYRGALWVRKSPGVYDDTPLCPRCGNTMYGFGMVSHFPVECGDPKCKHRANFSRGESARPPLTVSLPGTPPGRWYRGRRNWR